MGRTAQRAQTRSAAIEGQEGSRWVNRKPTGEELAAWFKANLELHEGLKHDRYVQGIVVIEQKERYREVRDDMIVEGLERLVYTPYPTASARLVYFRDWMALNPEWSWAIEPDPSVRQHEHLPKGFFRYAVDDGSGKVVNFLGCSMKVGVYERDLRAGGRGREVMAPSPGTKIVPVLGRYGPDENAIMKAQTGAIGRALGFAGMLVLPGTGLATAEDMHEALSGGRPAPGGGEVQATLPEDDKPDTAASSDVDLRARVEELMGRLQADHPDKHAEIQAWARERKLVIAEADVPRLRGVVRKLEKALEEAGAGNGDGDGD